MRLVLLLFLMPCIVGCGDDNTLRPTAPDAEPGGVWNGQIIENTEDTEEPPTTTMFAVSTDSGALQISFPESGAVISVQMIIDGSAFTASGKAFAAHDGSFADGSTVTDIELMGDIMTREGLSGTWSTTSGENGSFILDYDAAHAEGSSLTLVSGLWNLRDLFENPFTVFVINLDGALTGQSIFGCIINGEVATPDTRYNVYEWSMQLSNCDNEEENGFYSGLGTTERITSPEATFPTILNSDNSGALLPLAR